VVMKDGFIQQIDTPLALYHKPANLFVAGFLGSPPMNFINGKLKDAPDGVIFKEMEGGVLECKFTGNAAARAFAGKDVVLGVRPEDIELVQDTARPSACRFQAVVDIVEPMGAETNFYLQTGAHTVVCRSEASVDHSEVGHRLQFEMTVSKAHLFDPVTTDRIV